MWWYSLEAPISIILVFLRYPEKFLGTQKQAELAMVNKLLVFASLKFYCGNILMSC